ncbi:MAG: Gfo/Idh/MocA family oxidoreductase [Clostridia bacterium]|nr:Gfo/Idh/MocA family oxidoreductase [Clostridia bacterium]
MLKVGLVGVGGISGAHIPAWLELEDAELVAICDIRPEMMEKYPDIRQYTDFDEMLENEEFDILDICLPTYLHADFAIKAMEKGINVICEKPISLNREDVKRIYDTAEKNNVKFMVAQVLRFWREYEFVKEAYDSGRYGKLLSGNMVRLSGYPTWSWDNWMRDEKRCGLVPFDLHIHDLDFLVYAFGAPKKTTSFRSKLPEQDYIRAVYDFDGFFVSAESSWYASPYPFTANFRFQFENAIIATDKCGLVVYESNGNIINLDEVAEGDTGEINLPKSDAYANEIIYFVDCVKNNRPVEKVKPAELEAVIDILKSL